MLGTVTSTEKKALETLTAVKRAGYDGLACPREREAGWTGTAF